TLHDQLIEARLEHAPFNQPYLRVHREEALIHCIKWYRLKQIVASPLDRGRDNGVGSCQWHCVGLMLDARQTFDRTNIGGVDVAGKLARGPGRFHDGAIRARTARACTPVPIDSIATNTPTTVVMQITATK